MKRKHICKKCGFNTQLIGKPCSRCANDKNSFGGNMQVVLKRDKFRCVKCGLSNKSHIAKWKKQITIDHIDKNRKNNSLNNLQTLCIRCHCSKDARHPLHKLNGQKKRLREWSEIYGLSPRLVRCRIYKCKWPLLKSLTTPVMTLNECGRLGGIKNRKYGVIS